VTQLDPRRARRLAARAALAGGLLALAALPGSLVTPGAHRAQAAQRAHAAAISRSVLVADGARTRRARRHARRRHAPRPLRTPPPALVRPRVLHGVAYGPLPRERADVHLPLPPRSGLAPAALLVHGGGWAHGNRRRMTAIADAFARAGFVAVDVDYALLRAGLDGLPQQRRDLRRAVRWMRASAQRLGIDPARIGALGTSAGGHLAALLATSGSGPLDAGSRVAAVVTWSAPLDLGALPAGWLGGVVDLLVGCPLRGGCPALRAAASPIAAVTPDDPPMLLFNSRRELVPATQAERMAAALRAAGVRADVALLDGALHAREYAPQALAPSVAWLRRVLG
jgi:acetyl esterase/lipase